MIDLSPEHIVALYRKYGYTPIRGTVGKGQKMCCPIGILYLDATGGIPPSHSDNAYNWFAQQLEPGESAQSFWAYFDQEPGESALFWAYFDQPKFHTADNRLSRSAVAIREALEVAFGRPIPSITQGA